jgi:hypothetical protein
MNDIEEFCEKYNIKNYTINDDGTIDVKGDVNLSNKLGKMKKLPVKFGKVYGYFYCSYNQNLTTLEGCPYYVGGEFSCNLNKLTSLEGCPKYVGHGFDCRNNKLTTLKGIEKCEIIGSFDCRINHNIPSENYKYILTAKIGGKIKTGDGDIDYILNTYKNEVKYLHKALSELKKVKMK